MELRQVVLARVLQLTRNLGAASYLPDLVAKIQEKYQFVLGPKIQDLVPGDPSKGIEFKHGKLTLFGRTVVIHQLSVFNDGIAVDTLTSTDDGEAFINDLTIWAEKEMPNVPAMGPRFFVSQLEVRTSNSFNRYRSAFYALGEAIRTTLKAYGIETPAYEVSAINLYFDQVGKMPPQPGVFYIDRKVGIPYGENVWLSQAPMRTNDHLKLLTEMD
jgi:hypothetical protein